jgi:hypothetical protein
VGKGRKKNGGIINESKEDEKNEEDGNRKWERQLLKEIQSKKESTGVKDMNMQNYNTSTDVVKLSDYNVLKLVSAGVFILHL